MRLINKEELKALLAYYDDLYYNQDISEISDFEYSALKDSYIEVYGEYDYVPGEASKDSKKYTHTTNISSLSKLQITDEAGIRENLERLWPVVIQEKMDGLTQVTYPDGEDVTRGNGYIGEIVTDNAKRVAGRGDTMAYPIRSEVVMLHSEFDRINSERIACGLEPFENCRNAAAGMLRQKDPNKVQGLKAFAYNMIFDEEEIDEEDPDAENPNARAQVQIESLGMLGWNTVDSYEPADIEDAIDYIMNYDRSLLDFDIDGLVIKHNGNKIFGQTSHHPLNAVAIKFAPEGGWTTLINIEWSVGRTGKVVPKAIFEPISILGSTVTKATLHNIGIVNALGLNMTESIGKYGDCITKIFVIKANDVIPAIIDVEHAPMNTNNLYTKSIWEPKTCPDCGSDLRKEKDQLYCSNENCSSRVLNRLIHLSERDRFNIEDLGEETAIKLIAKYKSKLGLILTQIENSYEVMTEEDYDEGIIIEEATVKEKLEKLHPSFIYELTLDDIKSLEGFAEKSATNLYNEIQNSKNIDFDKFLAGCGIHLVGRRTSKDIAEFYYSPKDMSEVEAFAYDYADGFKKLSTLKGIGKETIASLIEYYGPYIIPFGEYGLNIKDVVPKKKTTNQMSIVVTGAFDKSRDEIKAMIEDAGHKMAGSVSKSTAYILIGEDAGFKADKAKSLGIKEISLKELEKILEQ